MTTRTKTILFVTYGGGHVTMVAPVLRALADYADITTELLALTTAGTYCQRQEIPYLGFKDFITPEDRAAHAWGEKLASQSHRPDTGISKEEAIAYLGLSYYDLVLRHGEEKAAKLWTTQSRGAFLPLSVLERVIARLNPDMVVSTSSPRAERAAITVANAHGIPTMSMVDLFGLLSMYKLEADYVTVLSKQVIDNMIKDAGEYPGQQFLVLGNPAFDLAYDYRGPINHAWRKEHFPGLPDTAKALLWIDDSGSIDTKTGVSRERSEAEVHKDLDLLARVTKENHSYLLIRPHPSQQRSLFDSWLTQRAHPHTFFAGHVPLHPLLNASDAVATYTSTVGVEAILMQRPVIQLKYYPGSVNMHLDEWGLARGVKTPNQLSSVVHQALYDAADPAIADKIAASFPDGKAAPKIAAAIHRIVTAK